MAAKSGTIRMGIKLTGFRETLRLLKTEELAIPAWPNAMEEVADLGAAALMAHAPIRTGATVNRVVRRVQKKPIPRWAVAATKATRRSPAHPTGYPYPRITAFSPYAQSRYRKGVNRNKGWFDRGLRRIEAGLEMILQRAADAMARKWES